MFQKVTFLWWNIGVARWYILFLLSVQMMQRKWHKSILVGPLELVNVGWRGMVVKGIRQFAAFLDRVEVCWVSSSAKRIVLQALDRTMLLWAVRKLLTPFIWLLFPHLCCWDIHCVHSILINFCILFYSSIFTLVLCVTV